MFRMYVNITLTDFVGMCYIDLSDDREFTKFNFFIFFIDLLKMHKEQSQNHLFYYPY